MLVNLLEFEANSSINRGVVDAQKLLPKATGVQTGE